MTAFALVALTLTTNGLYGLLALGAVQFLGSLLFQVNSSDTTTLIFVFARLPSSTRSPASPALRVTCSNPMIALREE
ncbi:MAG: hypothetical protein M2R45_03240 [Verrucomicrobia subdivision 3 bacterium]|nr:hypothetical protein [Limisphaerales bacterium]MCS1416101.1 hypothetical protein [Limisphaerales bacterium]